MAHSVGLTASATKCAEQISCSLFIFKVYIRDLDSLVLSLNENENFGIVLVLMDFEIRIRAFLIDEIIFKLNYENKYIYFLMGLTTSKA